VSRIQSGRCPPPAALQKQLRFTLESTQHPSGISGNSAWRSLPSRSATQQAGSDRRREYLERPRVRRQTVRADVWVRSAPMRTAAPTAPPVSTSSNRGGLAVVSGREARMGEQREWPGISTTQQPKGAADLGAGPPHPQRQTPCSMRRWSIARNVESSVQRARSPAATACLCWTAGAAAAASCTSSNVSVASMRCASTDRPRPPKKQLEGLVGRRGCAASRDDFLGDHRHSARTPNL
jgi:hypothetical protein